MISTSDLSTDLRITCLLTPDFNFFFFFFFTSPRGLQDLNSWPGIEPTLSAFHCMNIPFYIFLFSYWCAFSLFPVFLYYKQNDRKHLFEHKDGSVPVDLAVSLLVSHQGFLFLFIPQPHLVQTLIFHLDNWVIPWTDHCLGPCGYLSEG